MAEAAVRAGPTLLTTAHTTQTIWTAGALGTYGILRTILVCHEGPVGASAINFTIGIGTTNADAAGKRIVNKATIHHGQVWSENFWIPLFGHATIPDLVYALCDTAAGVSITLAMITGP
jgi:hypothetical protein